VNDKFSGNKLQNSQKRSPDRVWHRPASMPTGLRKRTSEAAHVHAPAKQTTSADRTAFYHRDRRHHARRCYSLCCHRVVMAGRASGSALRQQQMTARRIAGGSDDPHLSKPGD